MASDGSRRALLVSTATAAGWLAATACGSAVPHARAADEAKGDGAKEDVSANEDLMREHGVLDRLLLVYEAGVARAAQPPVAQAIHHAAELVSSFIEQYHEKLEEDFIFPLLEKAQRHVAEVRTLRSQHVAGRAVTQAILQLTAPGGAIDAAALAQAVQAFVRMYRPHAAREDTIIFPTLHEIASPAQLAELGERFEDVEHERFGKEGFESIVRQVEELERALGTYELAQFTPTAFGAR
jgi:hemerythrin-like domain-containing protein